MYFPAKKDSWYFVLIWGVVLSLLLLTLFNFESTGNQLVSADSLLGKILVGMFIIPLVWFWFGTGYTVTNSKVIYKLGPIRGSLKISDIRELKKVKSPLTAPALSIDRIAIIHGRFSDSIHVSPKDKHTFVQLLVDANPQIQIDEALSNDLQHSYTGDK